MTKRFAGIVLRPQEVDGEHEPESIGEMEKIKKSLGTCQSVLDGFTYAGFSCDSVVVDPEDSPTVVINGVEVNNNLYTKSDLLEVNSAYQGRQTRQKMKELEEGKLILKEIRKKNNHEDRRRHMITFVRCNKTLSTCCHDCRVRKPRVPRSVMDNLPQRESGAQFYVPMVDMDVNETGKHFITFTQQLEFLKLNKNKLASGEIKLMPDSDLSSEVERCKV